MSGNSNSRNLVILILLCYVFFMLGNGIISLSIPDEVFYAQTAREMAQRNSWMTPYMFAQPQFEKPVFIYWLLRIAFLIFGVTSFSARFFPALFGAIGVIAVYLLGLFGLRDQKKAFLAALLLLSCGLYVGLARTVFTDMVFAVFIQLSLTAFWWGYAFRDKKTPALLLFYGFSALAVLTKGPLGFLIPAAAVLFLLIRKELKFLFCPAGLWGLVIFALLAFPWYILMIAKYGREFTREFFYNDHFRRLLEAEHPANDTWYFYPASIAACIFPWSLFVIASLIRLARKLSCRKDPFYLFLACWIGVTLLIFQPAHSKLISYIFPMFAALALLSGDYIEDELRAARTGRLFFSLCLATAMIFLFLAAASIAGSFYFSEYMPSSAPLYPVIAALVLLSLGLLVLLRRGRLRGCILAFSPLVLIFLSSVPVVSRHIEPYLSSRPACEYLLKNFQVDNTILSSKFFVRGVKYYTGYDVAVIDIPGTPFFSPHPIPFLNTHEKVRELFRRQAITYCFLKRNALIDIKRIAGKEFKYAILNQVGSQYIVRVQRAE